MSAGTQKVRGHWGSPGKGGGLCCSILLQSHLELAEWARLPLGPSSILRVGASRNGWGLGGAGRRTRGSAASPSPRMILSVLTGLLFGSDGYYVALAWTSAALMYFTVSPAPALGTAGDSFPSHLPPFPLPPGAFPADGSPGPRQYGVPGTPAASAALPDPGSCSLPAPHHILADFPPGPVTPAPPPHSGFFHFPDIKTLIPQFCGLLFLGPWWGSALPRGWAWGCLKGGAPRRASWRY